MDLLDTQDLWDGPNDYGQERWTTLDEQYSISDYGRIWSAYIPRNQTWDSMEHLELNGRQGLLKRFYTDRYGYFQVELHSKRILVHRLVALYWIPNPQQFPMVLHCDGNPRNNNFRNLRWGTAGDNTNDAQKHGTYRSGTGRKTEGSYSVDLLYSMADRGLPVKKIARMLGLAPSSVRYRIKTRP